MLHVAELNNHTLRDAWRRVMKALGHGPDAHWEPGDDGVRLHILLAGRQDALPLALDIPMGPRKRGPIVLRGAATTLSFPDLMTGALDSDDALESVLTPFVVRFGVSCTGALRDEVAQVATSLAAVKGPMPWPEPLRAPQRFRVTVTERSRRSTQLARVFDDGLPPAVRDGLAALLRLVEARVDRDERHVQDVLRRWLTLLQGSEDGHTVLTTPAPRRRGVAIFDGVHPPVDHAYGFDDHLAYSEHDGVLTYRTSRDEGTWRRVDLTTGDVTDNRGVFADAPEFKLANLRQVFPMRRHISPSTQLPLKLVGSRDAGATFAVAWAVHYDAHIGPVLRFCSARHREVMKLSKLAPGWPSAPLIALSAASSERFVEIADSSPAALLLLSREPTAITTRYPLDAALEAWQLPTQGWLRRWIQRVDPSLLSREVLEKLRCVVRGDPEDSARLRTRVSHDLLSSPSTLMAGLDCRMARCLSNADLRLIGTIDQRNKRRPLHLYESLRLLLEAADYLGVEPPLTGFIDRAKTVVRRGDLASMEAAYQQCITKAAACFQDALREATVLRKLGVDRVNIPTSVVDRFAYSDDTMVAVPLTSHASIRGWGLSARGGENCLAYCNHLLTDALCGRQLFIGLGPPARRRFRRSTLALQPVLDHAGPWRILQIEGARGRRMTPPAKEAFNRYMDALEARGVEIVTPSEAHRLRHGRAPWL